MPCLAMPIFVLIDVRRNVRYAYNTFGHQVLTSVAAPQCRPHHGGQWLCPIPLPVTQQSMMPQLSVPNSLYIALYHMHI